MRSGGKTFRDVTHALVTWQDTGEERSLEFLVATTCAELRHLAAVSLRRQGVADPSAIDDTLSLVFDHLRRLRGTAPGERAVARFDAVRTSGTRSGDGGKAYLAWLVRERALDVARQRRRLARHVLPLSTETIQNRPSTDTLDSGEEASERCIRIRTAVTRLEPRLRTVVQLLLEGKSQAVIAHVLGVCEGTVSRARRRAVADLSRLMDE